MQKGQPQLGADAILGRVEQIVGLRCPAQVFGGEIVLNHIFQRLERCSVLAHTRFQHDQALVGRSKQALPFGRGLERHQLDKVLDAFLNHPARRRFISKLFTTACQLVAKLFRRLERGACVRSVDGAAVPLDGLGAVLGLGIGQAEGFGHVTHTTPPLAKLVFEKSHPVTLQLDGRVAVTAADCQGFERERKCHRRRNPVEHFAGRECRALRVRAAPVPAPARVAVALVGRPGVAVRTFAPGSFARRSHRVNEAFAAQQHRIKSGRKFLSRPILDGPARRNDTAHADLDQCLGDVGGEGRAVIGL